MKSLIMCLAILGARPALADTIGDVSPEAPSYPACAPFNYPTTLSDAEVFKRTMGSLSDEAIIAEVRRKTGNKLAIGLVHSEIGIGLITNAHGCKELVDSIMAIGKRYSDGCLEYYMIMISDQNVAANAGKFDVTPLMTCPQHQDQAQSFQSY